jgi:hypothetical protein
MLLKIFKAMPAVEESTAKQVINFIFFVVQDFVVRIDTIGPLYHPYSISRFPAFQ